MNVNKCELEGLLVIELDIYKDDRGFFTERYNVNKFHDMGIINNFLQDNHSRSKPNVIRGLHLQNDPAQGKLVSVTRGAIWDIAVDMRPNSKTFKKYFGVELSDTNGKMLWIPAGFAHGFAVISEIDTDVVYKVDALYNPKSEVGMKWDDETLGIKWPISNPIVSARDDQAMSFKEYQEKYLSN